MDVQHKAQRRRYSWRLIGSEAQAGKQAKPGQPLETHVQGEELARALAVLDRVVERHEPSWGRGRPVMPHAPSVVALERLILPLATDGFTVDMLLGVTVYSWNADCTGAAARQA